MIILTPETKTCMSHLLTHETFDHFSFIEGEIITFGKFTMSGFLQKSFFDEPPKEEYALWKLFRDYCYSIELSPDLFSRPGRNREISL